MYFIIFYHVLNILVYIFPHDGGWPPKHVAEIKKLRMNSVSEDAIKKISSMSLHGMNDM